MKHIQLFEKYTKIPKWFYLVLRNREETYQNLTTLELKGLQGISDNELIAKKWFDVRDVMLIMPYREVMSMNEIEKIDYYAPDYLVKNNFEILRRLTTDIPFYKNGEDIAFSGLLHKFFQNITHRKHKWSNKKYVKHSRKPISDLLEYLGDSRVYYKLDDAFEEPYHKGKLKINTVKDIAVIIKNKLPELNVASSYSYDSRFKRIEEKAKKSSLSDVEHAVKVALYNFANSFSKEGEWKVNNNSFKIPQNSYLYFKVDDGNYTKYGTRGLSKEKLDEIINNYPSLNNLFQVKTISNHEEMFKLISDKFSN